ncbi:MAG: exo-alpha-sialidase [Frankiaceae bacterium]|nr:exo-alpha-sialidase [Frankiaceae bacterium]
MRRLPALGALLLCSAAILTVAAAPAPASPPPSCSGLPPVVSHLPSGTQPKASSDLVACGGSTGYAGAESHLVATPTGAVVFTPAVLPQGFLGTGTAPVPVGEDTQSNASPAGQAITKDGGRTWQLVKPLGITWNPTDHGDYVDPVTGRLFFADYGPIPFAPELGPEQEGPAHLMWSPDDGKTWHHSAIDTVFLPENPRFTSAPPPAGGARPVGYPNVVYFCANSNVGFTSPVIGSRSCYASLDGGTTWTEQGVVLRGAPPVHSECGAAGEDYSAIDGSYPQPASDGSLYLMVSCGGATYLARSTDEAATFPILKSPSGAPLTLPLPPVEPGLNLGLSDLRIGTGNVMYLVSQETREARVALMLRVSRDLGRTWSRPVDLLAPGLSASLHWAMDVRGDQLAVAYLGHKPGVVTWDGWITTTTGAAAALARGQSPRLSSGQVNAVTRPLLYGDQVQGGGTFQLPGPLGNQVPFPPPFDIQEFGNDFIGAVIDSRGVAWGSYTQDCGPAPGDARCVAQKGQTRGYAGHLEAASAAPPRAVAPPAARPAPNQLPATGSGPAVAGLGLLVLVVAVGVRRVVR